VGWLLVGILREVWGCGDWGFGDWEFGEEGELALSCSVPKIEAR
jgi:hypothetical protein